MDGDYREEAVQPLIVAIGYLRGVAQVDTHVTGSSDYMARERARRDLVDQLWAVLNKKE